MFPQGSLEKTNALFISASRTRGKQVICGVVCRKYMMGPRTEIRNNDTKIKWNEIK